MSKLSKKLKKAKKQLLKARAESGYPDFPTLLNSDDPKIIQGVVDGLPDYPYLFARLFAIRQWKPSKIKWDL